MTSQDKKFDRSGNQGEGNQGAGARYDHEASRFAHSGQAERKAQEARRAVDGPEGRELRRAEQAGKSRRAEPGER